MVGVHSPETEHEADLRGIRDFVRTHDIRWKVVLDPALEAWRRYRVQAWPTIVLIDRAGVIRAAFVGDDSAPGIRVRLDELLSEPAPAVRPVRARAAGAG